jgi:putative (di)nucleoside polyphosphate hydrolase
MLLNEQGQVFIAKRIDVISDSWQMPQGGIDRGESAEDAAMRELLEEIGTNNVQIIARSKKEYKYDLPNVLGRKLWHGRYRGQRQTWFLMNFLGTDDEINIDTHHPEFCDWRWAEVSELLDLVIPFKRGVYQIVINEFLPYLKPIST